jgi:NAD(P)-dependent dehydrogenase (short-subunit alcohol dehydrogenase family)
MDLGLEGKKVLVTAASRGIGRAIAEEFAAEGSDVAICARGKEGLDEAVAALRSRGSDAVGIPADVTRPDDIERVVAATVDHHGRIDVLVNNAGDAWSGRTLDTTEDQWAVCLDVNLLSTVRFTRAVVPHMRRAGGGRIVNVSTVGAHSPIPGLVDYEAAKAAMLCFSKSMANELAADNILVNSVCPALIHTPLWDRLAADMASASGGTPDAVFTQLAELLPVKRFGRPEEVSGMVAFLASDRASFVTGIACNIDGGYTKSIA